MSVYESASQSVRSQRGAGLSVAILAFSAFLIVTTEFLIIGLLPALARDLDISISMAGQLVTLFAFTVMIFGPPLTAMLSHLDRKKLFVAILLIFAASNALAAVSDSFWLLAVARLVPALALPVFWGTASETAGQLAGPKKAGQAIANVYLGISAAMLLGIPLGTLVSNALGWRGAFWLLAGLSLIMALAILAFMPAVSRTAKVDFLQQAKIFKEPYFLSNVLLSIVVFSAMFTAYTYLADILERVAGVHPENIGWWLMAFGAVGLIGNWIADQGQRALFASAGDWHDCGCSIRAYGSDFLRCAGPVGHCQYRSLSGQPGPCHEFGLPFQGTGGHHQRVGGECRHRYWRHCRRHDHSQSGDRVSWLCCCGYRRHGSDVGAAGT